MPAVISHKAAVSLEVLMMVVRAARTSQGSHDLESQLLEFRKIKKSMQGVGFYALQGWLRTRPSLTRMNPLPPVYQYNFGVSTISDTYLADALLTFYSVHEVYINQFFEQKVPLDIVQVRSHTPFYCALVNQLFIVA